MAFPEVLESQVWKSYSPEEKEVSQIRVNSIQSITTQYYYFNLFQKLFNNPSDPKNSPVELVRHEAIIQFRWMLYSINHTIGQIPHGFFWEQFKKGYYPYQRMATIEKHLKLGKNQPQHLRPVMDEFFNCFVLLDSLMQDGLLYFSWQYPIACLERAVKLVEELEVSKMELWEEMKSQINLMRNHYNDIYVRAKLFELGHCRFKLIEYLK